MQQMPLSESISAPASMQSSPGTVKGPVTKETHGACALGRSPVSSSRFTIAVRPAAEEACTSAQATSCQSASYAPHILIPFQRHK
eukprot:4316675-Prymnesium_polylepis.1